MGASHPDLAADITRYAEMLRTMGTHQRAEALYLEALPSSGSASPADEGATASTLLGLGRLMLDRGDAPGAERVLRDASSAVTCGRREWLTGGTPRSRERLRRPSPLRVGLARRSRCCSQPRGLCASHGGEARERAVLQDVVEIYERLGRADEAARYRANP